MNNSDIKQNRIKILHIIATNFIGGPEKQILNHLRYYNREKFEIHVGSYIEHNRPNEFLNEMARLDIPYLKINQRFLFDFSIIRQIKDYIRKNGIDIVITHGYKSNILGSLAKATVKVPQAMYVRGWTSENLKIKIYNVIEKLFLRRAGLIITVAKRKADELEASGIPAHKIRYISNSVEIPSPDEKKAGNLHRDFDLPPEKPAIIAAGRLSPEKGHDVLLKALYIAKNRGFDFYCVIFGDGPRLEQLKKASDDLQIQDRVKFAGFAEDWKKYLGEDVLLVNPSRSEVMPNVVLEGLAYGSPVIATDVGGVGELIIDNYSGYLVLRNDPAAIAEKIMYHLGHKQQAQQLIDSGLRHVKENFSFEHQAHALEAVYQELYGFRTEQASLNVNRANN